MVFRYVGMAVRLALPDESGRLGLTHFAIPAETLADLCPAGVLRYRSRCLVGRLGRVAPMARGDGETLRVNRGTPSGNDDGKPIHGEVVSLKPRNESAALFDVEVQHDARTSTGRPAKVASEQYRKGWESIWAKKRGNRELN